MLFADLGCCGDYYKGSYRGSCGGSYGGCYRGSYRGCWWVGILFIDLAYCADCLGTVGVGGDVLALKLNGVENL